MIQHLIATGILVAVAAFCAGWLLALMATNAEREHGEFYMKLERGAALNSATNHQGIVDAEHVQNLRDIEFYRLLDRAEDIGEFPFDVDDEIDVDDDIDEVNDLGVEDLDEENSVFIIEVARLDNEVIRLQSILNDKRQLLDTRRQSYVAIQALNWVQNLHVYAMPSKVIKDGKIWPSFDEPDGE